MPELKNSTHQDSLISKESPANESKAKDPAAKEAAANTSVYGPQVSQSHSERQGQSRVRAWFHRLKLKLSGVGPVSGATNNSPVGMNTHADHMASDSSTRRQAALASQGGREISSEVSSLSNVCVGDSRPLNGQANANDADWVDTVSPVTVK